MGTDEFVRVFLPFRDAAYRVAFHFLESSQDAMDVVQDLYIRLWEKRDGLETVRNPKAYCITLVRNMCIDRVRHSSHIDPDAGIEECTECSEPPDERLQAREALQRIRDRMACLSEKERKVLYMRIFEELDYREISRRTGISALGLRVMVSNARRKLKDNKGKQQ